MRMQLSRKGRGVEKFGASLPKLNNFAASKIAKEYAEFVRTKYLSGQKLRAMTGETRRSVKFFKLQNGTFGVRPGSGIAGRLNYLYKFERGGRAFMGPSRRAFKRGGRPVDIAKEIYDKVIGRYRA